MRRTTLRRAAAAGVLALALAACGTDDGASVREIDGGGETTGTGTGTGSGSGSGTHTGSGSGTEAATETPTDAST